MEKEKPSCLLKKNLQNLDGNGGKNLNDLMINNLQT